MHTDDIELLARVTMTDGEFTCGRDLGVSLVERMGTIGEAVIYNQDGAAKISFDQIVEVAFRYMSVQT